MVLNFKNIIQHKSETRLLALTISKLGQQECLWNTNKKTLDLSKKYWDCPNRSVQAATLLQE